MKLGFYPLPSVEATRTRRLLQFPSQPFSALDPCIGDGAAFAAITADSGTRRYGIELDAYRAEQASSREGTAQGVAEESGGQAIAYTLSNWKALVRYCQDGDLEIDNNGAEGSLRPVAVGRKNWMFFGSDNGGQTAAVLNSLIATCKGLRTDPFAFAELRESPGNTSTA